MESKKFLIVAAALFAIGFIAAPAVALFHVPTEAGQVIIGINWISGGLAFVALSAIKGEIP
jgi:uncharacterized membrane protein YcfT